MPFQISPAVNTSELDLSTVIPAVSTTEAAIAGVFSWGPVEKATLIGSSDQLASTFGRPTSDNYETFYSGANFLAYGNKLYVSRAASTSGSANSYNAVANNGSAAGTYLVKNTDNYEYQESTISADTGVAYIAKYPGALGNSLKISVCDSANAYSSYIGTTSNAVTLSLGFTPGSNTATVYSVHATDGTIANTEANTFLSNLTVGDYIVAGNSSIGKQYLKISAIGAPSNSGATATATVTFESQYNLSSSINVASRVVATSFSAATTALTVDSNTGILVGGGISGTGIASDTVVTSISGTTVNISKPTTTVATSVNLTFNGYNRLWEYYNLVDKAPSTSPFVSQRNSNLPVDELHIVVVDKLGRFTGTSNQILEVFPALSRATDAVAPQGGSIYYKNSLNQTSRYVWFGASRSGAADAIATAVVSSTNYKPLTKTFVNGSDGNTESTIAMTDLARAWDKFKSAEEIDVSFLIQGKAPSSGNYVQLANYLIDNIALSRKDCMVCISPNLETVLNNLDSTSSITQFRNNLNSTSYWTLDTGYKYQYDKYNDVFRWIPLNGDIAGLMARTDTVRDPWFSPAGLNRGFIKNVIKLAFNPDKSQRDILYKSDVNPVITIPGQGTVLWGDKTGLGKPSAFDRINVRRLFIVLEKAIATAAKFTLFEFNDAFTRAQFRNLVEPYLRDVLGRRGIYEFRVVCDETNNTAEVIDSNSFVGDIYIKPAKSINFIQLNFVAVRSGVTFEEIVGNL